MTTTKQVFKYARHTFELADWVELRAIDAAKRIRKIWTLARDLPGLVPELERLNAGGFNIFVGPNPRAEAGLSGDKHVAVCRCLLADFDGIEPGDGCGILDFVEARIFEAGLPEPTQTVFSGHGLHAYWRLTEPLDPVQWRSVQERLIAVLDADRACVNPERLLRLPGFRNHKKAPTTDCFTMYAEAR